MNNLKPLTEKQERKIKESWRKAANGINSACEKRGRELVEEARQDKLRKIENSKKRTNDVAKDIAGYVVAKSRERISVIIDSKDPVVRPCMVCINNKYRGGSEELCDACKDFSNFKET